MSSAGCLVRAIAKEGNDHHQIRRSPRKESSVTCPLTRAPCSLKGKLSRVYPIQHCLLHVTNSKSFIMTRNEDIALPEVRVTDSNNRQSQNVEPQVTEQHISDADQTSARQWESYRKRASVLVGSSLSQLPIWGKSIHNIGSTPIEYPHRLCHELWCLSRVLYQQLDIERKPRCHWYCRDNLQWSHVPVDAIPLRSLHETMGPMATDCCSLRYCHRMP